MMTEDTLEDEEGSPSSRPPGRPFTRTPDQARTRKIVGRLQVRGLTNHVREIALRNHVTLEELLGRARSQHVCIARDELYLSLRGMGWSHAEVGRLLEVTHATVLQGVRRAERRAKEGQ